MHYPAPAASLNAMDTSTLLWSVLFGAIGAGFFIYGKKQRALVPLLCGLALMVFPYFVSNGALSPAANTSGRTRHRTGANRTKAVHAAAAGRSARWHGSCAGTASHPPRHRPGAPP